jgi:hypothetical protein
MRNPYAPSVPAPPAKRGKAAPSPANALDLASIEIQARSLAPGPFGFFLWFDDKLASSGFHRASDWWRWSLGEFYRSDKRFGVFGPGRGAGKSTTLERVACAETLFTPRSPAPGERWIWPFLSASLDDARRRVQETATMLRAIGFDAWPKAPGGRPTIELVDARGNPVAFVALACTITGVSGPSTIGATFDEEQKWKREDRTINPAPEVLASLISTFRAREGIRAIRCSSAWDPESIHARALQDGDTEANFVARIGERFLDVAKIGFLDVAIWEEARRNLSAATRLRAIAEMLKASSPGVPTWLGNPTISAVASRKEVEALPAENLKGLTRTDFWLREFGSILTVPGQTEDWLASQMRGCRDYNDGRPTSWRGRKVM